ncbi:MAG TPA: YbhN family protein [Acidimicrobiia bacterium]|nr:YbhN family protein [Acidimicrobiia bacterium]
MTEGAETNPAMPSRRRIVGRIVMVALFGISLYLVAPGLLAAFGSLPRLRDVFPVWFIAVALLQVLAFVSIWELTRVALKAEEWFDVACSQLAGNALSRALPGGVATGAALQINMLVRAGFSATRATTGLTAVGLLSTTTLLVLPVVALVPMLFGLAVDSALMEGAILAGVLSVFFIAGGFALLTSDRVVRLFGQGIDLVVTLVRRGRGLDPPMAGRVVEARDFVRSQLSESWRRAVPAAFGNQLFDFLSLFACLLAVGSIVDPALVLLAYVAASVLAMIPFTPGGLGFVEAGLTGVLTLAGVQPDHAVLATLLYRLFSYWLPLPAGLIASLAFSHRHGRRRLATDTP